MADPRTLLSEADARRFIGLPSGTELPDEETLAADLRSIVSTTLALGDEGTRLAEQGLVLSPLWEEREGVTHVRLAVLPPSFRTRYFEGDAREALAHPEVLSLVAQVLPWLAEDPVGAAFALDDIHRVWFDDTAPIRSLATPHRHHLRLASMLLADVARKAAAGLDDLEWLCSLGLPIDELREDDDPPVELVRASMKEHLDALWEEERGWVAAAFRRKQLS